MTVTTTRTTPREVAKVLIPVRWPPGWLMLVTPGNGWAIRYAGTDEDNRGWLFYRSLDWPGGVTWETWEPDLPYGVSRVRDKAMALEVLADLIDLHGDGPVVVL